LQSKFSSCILPGYRFCLNQIFSAGQAKDPPKQAQAFYRIMSFLPSARHGSRQLCRVQEKIFSSPDAREQKPDLVIHDLTNLFDKSNAPEMICSYTNPKCMSASSTPPTRRNSFLHITTPPLFE